MADQEEYQYIIGVGALTDWEPGPSSLYCIENRKGEKAMPVLAQEGRRIEKSRPTFGFSGDSEIRPYLRGKRKWLPDVVRRFCLISPKSFRQ